MSFISLAFLIFLALACAIYFVLPRAVRSFWLLVCSYLFYVYDTRNARFIGVLLGITLITWITGLCLEALQGKSRVLKRLVLAAALVLCFGCLAYFKYFTFLLSGLAALGAAVPQHISIAAPLGISYFTFQATGYLIDLYREKTLAEKNFFYYALFVSFFPCIVSGPIERAQHMLPQLKALQSFNYDRVTGGAFRILWGFSKKLVIADTMGIIVSAVYSHIDTYTGPVLLLASLLFSLQLYYDFSAGTDVAIGAGAIFGFTITENFKRPLAAPSFAELWRRWHISLTSWLRDYLYFPLGGNRKGSVRTFFNQMIVFVVSGLWHGASAGYLLWGALNGLYLCIGKATQSLRAKLERYNPLYFWRPMRSFLKACVTYLLFTSCMVFFASELFAPKGTGITSALALYAHLGTGWAELFSNLSSFTAGLVTLGFTAKNTAIILGGIVLVEGMEWPGVPVHKLIRRIPIVLRWPLYWSLCLAIFFLSALGQSPLIYQAY